MTWDVPWSGEPTYRVMYLKMNGGHLDIPSTPKSLAQLPGTDKDKAAFQRVAAHYTQLIKQVRLLQRLGGLAVHCSAVHGVEEPPAGIHVVHDTEAGCDLNHHGATAVSLGLGSTVSLPAAPLCSVGRTTTSTAQRLQALPSS